MRTSSFSDSAAWRENAGELELHKQSEYHPPQRSPRNLALLDTVAVSSFVLELEAQQTGREYGHRDLCVFLGYQNESQYYYAHIATAPDERAHNLFLVNQADRNRDGASQRARCGLGHERVARNARRAQGDG